MATPGEAIGRERTVRSYNLHLLPAVPHGLRYPPVHAERQLPSQLIPFNVAMTSRRHEGHVHFFIDDYQFERVWGQPEKYRRVLEVFDGAIAPDFSTYLSMPEPMVCWNVYRSRALAALWQWWGVPTIPVLQWAGPDTVERCIEGVPHGSLIACSATGVPRTTDDVETFLSTLWWCVGELDPAGLVWYGDDVSGMARALAGVQIHRYDNPITNRTRTLKRKAR